MKINILFFASVREMFKTHKKDVEILDSENSPNKLLNILSKREGGSWALLLNEKDSVRVAINQELCGWDDMLNDGDELAFFPPITGG
jgi:molybdopterin synthase sulfur carrier subunit|tara:strand:+ start:520 stop:780 length:261 start_codon:yes stop_codon:yes gene_type:complete